jgi:hypothetical protein
MPSQTYCPKFKQLLNAVEEFRTYIGNNAHLIPNYGERYRHGIEIGHRDAAGQHEKIASFPAE